MTLGAQLDLPAMVRASRRRAMVRGFLRVARNQRDREVAELGYLDIGGEGAG